MQNRPKINVSIVRKDDKVQITVGNASLVLIPVIEGGQVYDFLVLEQFITRIAIGEYSKIVRKEQIKKDLESLKDNKEGSW